MLSRIMCLDNVSRIVIFDCLYCPAITEMYNSKNVLFKVAKALKALFIPIRGKLCNSVGQQADHMQNPAELMGPV